MRLNNNEMMNIKGGAVLAKVVGIVGATLVFLIGVVVGYVNPNRCNK